MADLVDHPGFPSGDHDLPYRLIRVYRHREQNPRAVGLPSRRHDYSSRSRGRRYRSIHDHRLHGPHPPREAHSTKRRRQRKQNRRRAVNPDLRRVPRRRVGCCFPESHLVEAAAARLLGWAILQMEVSHRLTKTMCRRRRVSCCYPESHLIARLLGWAILQMEVSHRLAKTMCRRRRVSCCYPESHLIARLLGWAILM